MREILFRGKRSGIIDHENDGEWTEGGYIEINGKSLIMTGDHRILAVDPSTVGQYTGLNDKNGKKIFEGDIVHYIYDGGKENGWKADQNSIIKWDFSGFYMDGIFGSNKYACRSGWLENIACNGGKFFEVIGNIHDNPELLENNS